MFGPGMWLGNQTLQQAIWDAEDDVRQYQNKLEISKERLAALNRAAGEEFHSVQTGMGAHS